MARGIEPLEGKRIVVPHHMLPKGGRADYFVLRVVGDSMDAEHVLDGDYVVLERRETPQPGEACCVLVGDEATIKRYYPEGPQVRLQPLDPSQKPARVPAGEVRVQGVVVGLMRRY